MEKVKPFCNFERSIGMKKHCFKVGDMVKWSNTDHTSYEIERARELVIESITEYGNLKFNNIKGYWFKENFELCKNQVVINILNDL